MFIFNFFLKVVFNSSMYRELTETKDLACRQTAVY
jgi:hypothetical protein